MAVIVTGCSSGFGYSLATRLATSGVTVFAGVRKREDGEKVRAGTMKPENVHPILCDVTNVEQVAEAAREVRSVLEASGKKLLAVVNNAGYGEFSPVECIELSRIRSQFEVNVVGLVAMTQKFIPLLREHGPKGPLRPRVVNLSSGAGRISLPAAGIYSASKFAVEAISDALRVELMPWGIHVLLVEPGRFHTEFQNKAYSADNIANAAEMDPAVQKHYISKMQKVNEHSASRNRPHMDHCVKTIEDSLFDTRPLPRYLAGTDVQFGIPVANHFPEYIKDTLLGGMWKKF